MRFLMILAAAAALTSPALAQSSDSMKGMSGSSMAMPSCKAGNPVVWLNTDSNVYFKRGSSHYGKTKEGKFVCRNTAVSMGAHKAKSGMSMRHHMMSGSMASPDAMSH